ncbi:MAG: ankyrin repeat domain-containing protein [Nibricoccus sp.]
MIKWLPRVMLLLACLIYSPLRGQQPAKSPFIGTWSVRIPDYGWIALNVGDNGGGQISGAGLWWFVELLDRGFATRVEGSRLYLETYNHKHQRIPCFSFELTIEGKLRLLSGGIISDPIPSPFSNLILDRNQKMFFWHELTSYRIDASDYNKWHDHGSLKALPVTWQTDVAVATGRLFALDDHLLKPVLALPSLPASFLAEVYGWTQEKPAWNEGIDYIIRAIAQNPNCEQSILEKIWQHPDNPQLWLAAAANRNARPEWGATVVDRIMKSDERVKSRATWDGSGPSELYERLIQDGPKTRAELASSRKMPTFVYETLMRDFATETRMALARNEAVPTTLIEELALLDDRNLRMTLIYNRQLAATTRSRLVKMISQTAVPKEFSGLAYDRDAPPEFLSRCAADLDPGIRTNVASNSQTDQATLLRLANDEARETARTARESLKKRFPTVFAQVSSTLTPLETLEQDCSPLQRFRQAIERSDLKELTHLTEYLRTKDELESVLSATANDVIKAYRPAVMDFFLAQDFNKYHVALTDLAAQCGGDQQWLSYFKAHGAFDKSLPGRAYEKAIETGRVENVAGLIKAKVDVNQQSSQNMSALHHAVIRRNLTMVALLVDAGAKFDVRDQYGRTPLDYAVLAKFIPAIKLLDREKKHTAIIEQFTNEFPSAPKDSPFLGQWTNNRDGFYTVVIKFDSEGTGYLSASIASLLIAWRSTAKNEAVAFIFNEKGEVEKSMPIHLLLDPVSEEIIFEPQKGEKQRLRRIK